MRNVSSLETVERDYSPRGVKFYYIYKALAHPETNGYITPFTLEERLLHVAEAKQKLGSRITWLCDTMANDLKHALGDAPNSEFIIGPDGKIVQARPWSRPDELRDDLARLVGPVARRTTVADLDMPPLAPPRTAATGIVPRVQVPAGMMPVRVEPIANDGSPGADEPYYVKLRAELDARYWRSGAGKLYLGFFLDPLYKVHWNNAAAPVVFELKTPAGLTIEPTKGQGPKVAEDADADPREFLVDVLGETTKPIELTVRYFACDDAETFCKPVTQTYRITLERDRDGGARRQPSRRGAVRPGFRNDDETAQRRKQVLSEAVSLFRDLDVNEDGRLSFYELGPDHPELHSADTDSDDQVSPRELVAWLKRP